ncbi:unnamed protein product, partial [Cyprideis torosa]
MMVGAVLTQNTNWKNVEKAIAALEKQDLLDFHSLLDLSPEQLALHIKPAGYHNLKAKRLHNLLRMIEESYGGNIDSLLKDETERGRKNLLAVKGVGEETADCILLYGGGHAAFVVDAYTHRVFSRHHLVEEQCSYGELQERFVSNLPVDVNVYGQYHALIVQLGKEYCKKKNPRCSSCPLD